MEKRILSVSDFTPDMGVIQFDASVISIIHDGKKDEKKPIVATLKLESTGENFNISTWNFDLLPELRKMQGNLNFANFEGTTTTYKNELQIRVGKIKEIYLAPSQKKVLVNSIGDIENELKQFVSENIYDPFCNRIIDSLIINNPDFFKWPAAKSVHHNYPGGLAKHSLNVAKLILMYSHVYGNDAFDLQIALTGALIHDIGKLLEYTEDSDISFNGQFTTHLVSGVLILDRLTNNWKLENEYQKRILTELKHIIQSHHGTLEFGSPVTPKTIEAILVSQADLSDSRFESVFSVQKNQTPGTFSEAIRALDGGKIYKWKI